MNPHNCNAWHAGYYYPECARSINARESFTVTITQDANNTFTVRLSHSGNEYSAMVSGVLDYDTAQSLANDLVKVIC